MPRIGQNPLKWQKAERKPEKITITTIVHIPILGDYWQDSLAILRYCFESLRANTKYPFDLMVLDNGSCPEVLDYLLEAKRSGIIQFLILSEYNLRKLGALEFLLAAAPGEIVSFTDSDVYFLPGWLDESLRILQAFPEAGQVTALPTIDRVDKYTQSTYDAVKSEPQIIQKSGQLVPDDYVQAHATSLGISLETYLQRLDARKEILIQRGDVSAYVSAQDFQFTTTQKAIQVTLPFDLQPEDYYDPLYSPVFEAKLDRAGFWRLSTVNYLAHHMGNKLPNFSGELSWFPNYVNFGEITSDQETDGGHGSQIGRNRLFRSTRVRRALKRINSLSYRLLYE